MRTRKARPSFTVNLPTDKDEETEVGYVGAASGDDAEFRSRYEERLRTAGENKLTLAPLHGIRGNAQKAMTVLEHPISSLSAAAMLRRECRCSRKRR